MLTTAFVADEPGGCPVQLLRVYTASTGSLRPALSAPDATDCSCDEERIANVWLVAVERSGLNDATVQLDTDSVGGVVVIDVTSGDVIGRG